jgi:hypothetical protein
MKKNSQVPVLVCTCWLTCFAFSTSKSFAAEFSISDYNHYRPCGPELCTYYEGKVEAIVPDATGATIRYRVSHTQGRGGESKIPKSLDLHWSKADGPVPLAPGMEAWITIDPSEQLKDITYVAGISHWRKGKDGFVEVVLRCATLSKPSRSQLIYVRPARMDAIACWMNIHWTRKWGLLITIDGLGAASFEVEEVTSKRPALTLANAPEMEIVPGRDGWKALPSLNSYDESKDQQPTAVQSKAWDELSKAIPKAQYMKAAG